MATTKWEDAPAEDDSELLPQPSADDADFRVEERPDGSKVTITQRRAVEIKTRPDETKVRVTKRVITTVLERPVTMADFRAKWFHFGKENEAGLTVKEPQVPLELGGSDPDERRARDEVIKLLNLSLDAPVKVKALRKSALATTLATNQQVAAAAASSSNEPEQKTWAQARQTKKEQEQAAKLTTGPVETKNYFCVRIQNLTSEITETELRRLFGPENPALKLKGKIKKMFVSKDKDGNYRGFAYVTYFHDTDAAQVIQVMNKTRFKQVILALDYGTERVMK